MKNYVRIAALAISALMIFCLFGGCKGKDAEDGGKIKVAATIFPLYDWTREITASSDSIDLSLVLDNGVDLHSFQPTAGDMVKISQADVFIYTGGESDSWVEDALKEAQNKDMIAVNLLDSLGGGAKSEKPTEGAQQAGHTDETDEHIWLSLRNAEKLCGVICDKICEADPENSGLYRSNCESYCDRLSVIDREYASAVKRGERDALVVGDRFPFRYLCDDYGIKYYAAFEGCSAETEASFETIAFLAGKVDELGLNAVTVTESSDKEIAETIINNTKKKNQRIIGLNSMQSVKAEDIGSGTTYLSIAQDNLKALEKALK